MRPARQVEQLKTLLGIIGPDDRWVILRALAYPFRKVEARDAEVVLSNDVDELIDLDGADNRGAAGAIDVQGPVAGAAREGSDISDA